MGATGACRAAGCTTYSTLTRCDGERDLGGPNDRISISSIALDAPEERVVELLHQTLEVPALLGMLDWSARMTVPSRRTPQ